ncbi:unnamed protein product [Hymenolepis diminuta]|uniref:Uncharacterized protein n=1 Tax=Hymenolepis diminuta TaxID=6216 RepID=A0A564YW94_HYMDI|nr:unnamed protein product [Hymenolepis diminuta]
MVFVNFLNCCLLSNPQKDREIDSITSEGIANEWRKLSTKCDGGLNQKSGEHNYLNRISSEIMSGTVSALRKTLTEYWLCNYLHFCPILSVQMSYLPLVWQTRS